MPRLPTIRVIGSQAISTRLALGVLPVSRVCVAVMAGSPGPLRAGHELAARSAPLGFLVDGAGRHRAQPPDRRSVQARRRRRELAAGGVGPDAAVESLPP